jgi:hypothetical protein
MKEEIELFNDAVQQTEQVEVTFYVHEPWLGGERYEVHFGNGYGASVIRNASELGYSYGGREGLWELAVLSDNNGRWEITHDTTITDDVLGWLTEEDVINTLKKIAKM